MTATQYFWEHKIDGNQTTNQMWFPVFLSEYSLTIPDKWIGNVPKLSEYTEYRLTNGLMDWECPKTCQNFPKLKFQLGACAMFSFSLCSLRHVWASIVLTLEMLNIPNIYSQTSQNIPKHVPFSSKFRLSELIYEILWMLGGRSTSSIFLPPASSQNGGWPQIIS